MSHTLYGLRMSRGAGPKARSGSTGSTMAVKTASLRVAHMSSRSMRRMNLSSSILRERNAVVATAIATANAR